MKKSLLLLGSLTLFASASFAQVDVADTTKDSNAKPDEITVSIDSLEANPQGEKALGNPDSLAEPTKTNLQIDAPNAPPAPVNVTATAGTLNASYATLKDAFDAINAGTHQGDITIDVVGNTTETATASLNNSGAGSALYTSVLVRPSGGARTVTGSIVGAIIKLNGADNVTIDGRIGGTGRNLTVSNSSTATATAAIWLASVAAGNGCTNNVIRNLEIAAGQTANTGTNTTIGIYMGGTTISLTATDGNDNDNNSFISNRITRCRIGLATRGVTTNNNTGLVITDNIVGPDAFGPDEIGATGIFLQADTGAVITGNTVQFVGGALANTTAGADRCGICVGSAAWSATTTTTITSGDYTVTKNIIHDVVDERTFSAIGIQLATTRGGTPTNNLVANNFIYNLRSNGTAGDQVLGIGIAGGNTDRVVFNSISITGDMDPGAAVASTQYGNAIRIPGANAANNANFLVENNSIYLDVNSNTATVHFYAITLNSAAYSFGTGALNNNNYFINAGNAQLRTGGLASVTGGATTTEFATLANWQAALTAPQDAASIQADPLYQSITSNLHILGSSPNIGAAVTIAGIADDIDSEARPNGANPDIGADEFYPTVGSLQFSSTTYGGNEGTMVLVTVTRTGGFTGAVMVDYTLTNGSATGGAACGAGVDYVNPGTQTLTFADTVTSQTFTVELCTDGAVFDPNETLTMTLSNATGGATIGANNPATLTITDVPPPFNGSYNVGAGQTYTSLTNPGGIFEAINLAGASGNVTINIVSDLTGETGVVALNEVAGGFTVTIKPSGAARTITGSSTTNIIRINGADNVTIDGLLAGPAAADMVGGNPALRNLTIQNTNTTATAGAVVAVTEGTNGAQNFTIKNTNVTGQDPTQTLIGVHIGGNTIGTSPLTANNINARVENCSFQKAFIGVFDNGISAANPNTGNVITMNDLSATGANRLRRGGIFFFNQDGIQVMANDIGGIVGDEAADSIGIIAGNQGVTTTVTTSGGITNAMITGNRINGVAMAGVNDFSTAGIVIAGGTTGPNTIANNMISGVVGAATTPDLSAGIFVTGVTGSTTLVYFNSIAMTGDRGLVAAQFGSYGIAITGATTPLVDLKDNIFYTTQTSGGGANALSYVLGTQATTANMANLTSDVNLFFFSGAQAAGFRTGALGATGTDFATLAAWQAGTGKDTNSLSGDPLFVSPASDLHLTAGSPADNAGMPIAGITTDIDGDMRSATTPDIGADENATASLVVSAASRLIHGAAGPFDIDLPNLPMGVTAGAGIECRRGGGASQDQYTVVINFASPQTPASIAPVSVDCGVVDSVVQGANANQVLVQVSGACHNPTAAPQYIAIHGVILGVPFWVTWGHLIGDTNGNVTVNAGDVLQTRSRSGQGTDANNFRSDVTTDGFVNSGDTLTVRSRSGTSLP